MKNRLNSVTGALTGTPGLAEIGRYEDIVVTATDGSFSVQTTPFKIDVQEDPTNVFSSNIVIELFKTNGDPIAKGTPVTGLVNGRVTISNMSSQHAQFYKNFQVIKTNEVGHMIDSNNWVRTFEIDSTEFFDGENLLSVHAHPMNVLGQPHTTDFSVGALKIICANNNPAPNGDSFLPYMALDGTKFTVTSSQINGGSFGGHEINMSVGSYDIIDDLGSIDIDHVQASSNQAQVVGHLGASVLGRFRWTSQTPPFGDSPGRLIDGAQLLPFQGVSETSTRIIFFLTDAHGRANYAFQDITIPVLSTGDSSSFPLPVMDSKILNVKQGDTIVIEDNKTFTLKVRVDNPRVVGAVFPTMTTWVGNRAVADTDLSSYIANMQPEDTSFVVDVTIEASEIQKLQDSRLGGLNSTAFAIWNDFTFFQQNNMPSGSHVHVSSIRTSSLSVTTGPPSVFVMTPTEGDENGDGTIGYALSGDLSSAAQLYIQVNGGAPTRIVTYIGKEGFYHYHLSNLTDEVYTVRLFFTDIDQQELSTESASSSVSFLLDPDAVETTAPGFSQDILVELFEQDGVTPIMNGATISGKVKGKITITNMMMQHAQFYKNFRVLKPNEHAHMIDSNLWVRTFDLDSSEFFDGENLLSVHAHPMNVLGQPYTTDFQVGVFKFVSSNNNPSTDGDFELPTIREDISSVELTNNSELAGGVKVNGRVYFSDDSGTGKTSFDQDINESAHIQAIAHLGSSVLGRFRWTSFNPPFGDDNRLFGDTHLINFQKETETPARIVVFFNDSAGRANYGFLNVDIPAITAADRVDFPLPGLNAKIINVKQGDVIVVPESGSFNLQVEVTNPGPLADTFGTLSVWVGNRSVKAVHLNRESLLIPPGKTSVVFDVAIPGAEIKKLQDTRQGGQDNSAFAIWLDFTTGGDANLPSSEHIHVTSIRTDTLPWTYGSPTVSIQTPTSGHAQFGGALNVEFAVYGDLSEAVNLFAQIDNNTPFKVNSFSGSQLLANFDHSLLDRGNHVLKMYLTDSDDVALEGLSATDSVEFVILNNEPVAIVNQYSTNQNSTLNITVADSILKNDSDVEGDALTVSLVTTTENGNLVLNGDGSFTYTPDENYSGLDSFHYRANDGFSESEISQVLIAVVPTGNVTSLTGDWSSFGNGPEHTGVQSGYMGGSAPQSIWSVSFGDKLNQVAVADGRVYLTPFLNHTGNNAAYAIALDSLSGQELWRHDFPHSFSSHAPTYSNGNVFIQRGNHDLDSYLYSFDATSGSLNWQAPFRNQWFDFYAPTIVDGKIFVSGGRNGGMYSFDEQTGDELFFQNLQQYDAWTPLHYKGKVYSWAGQDFIEHDMSTGEAGRYRRFDLAPPYSMHAVAVGDNDIAYFTNAKELFAIGLIDFDIKWKINCNERTTPALADGFLYLSNGNKVDVYDAFQGQLLGSFSATSNLKDYQQPLITDDKLLVSSESETFIFDRFSFALIHTIPAGGHLSLAKNHLYIAGNDGILHCYQVSFPASPNTAPVISGTPIPEGTTVVANETFNFVPTVTDAVGDSLTFSIVNKPSWATFNTSDGTLSGTPSNVGVYSNIIITVEDQGGLTDSLEPFQIEVLESDTPQTPKLFIGLADSVTGTGLTITLPESYVSPIIVATPVNTKDGRPVVVRVQAISDTEFELKIQRADSLTEDPGSFKVTYMVVEEGVYNLEEHGIKMEAFRFNSTRTDSKNNWIGEQVTDIENTYTNPVMYGQVMSMNDDNWSAFWSRGTATANPVSNGNFYVGKHVGEDSVKSRNNEILACIVVEQGSYTIAEYSYNFSLGIDSITGVGNDGVNYTGYTADLAVATLSAMDGGDGGWAILYGSEKPVNGNLRLAVDEDTIGDSERSHTSEQLSVVTVRSLEDNSAPVANEGSANTGQDVSVTVTLTASDADGDALTYPIVTQPSNGTLSGTAPNLTYTPTEGFSGSDSFTFKANDGTVDSNTATVSITVNVATSGTIDFSTHNILSYGGNQDSSGTVTVENNGSALNMTGNRWKAIEYPYTVTENTVLEFDFSSTHQGEVHAIGFDTDLSLSSAYAFHLYGTQKPWGHMDYSNYSGSGTQHYVIPVGEFFTGAFQYLFFEMDDDATKDGNSIFSNVRIYEAGSNNTPLSENQMLSFEEDSSDNPITLTATDADSDALTYSVVSQPSNGTLSGTAPDLTYTPAAGFFGSDSFTFKANDGTVDSNIATISITVEEPETTETIRYEAEQATIVGGRVGSNNGGYSGTGFVDYVASSGDYVEWTVSANTASDAQLVFGYALSSSDRPLEIRVNGIVVSNSLSFPASGSWTNWAKTAGLIVSLNAGNNTVRASAIGSSGGNIDYLEVTATAPIAAQSAQSSLSSIETEIIIGGNGPLSDDERFQLSNTVDLLAANEGTFEMEVTSVSGTYTFYITPGVIFDYSIISDTEYSVTYNNSKEIDDLLDILFSDDPILEVKFK